LKLFVDYLDFEVGHNEINSAKSFCVVEKDGLRINLFEDTALAREHSPEFRLVTKNIEEVYERCPNRIPNPLRIPKIFGIGLRRKSGQALYIRENEKRIIGYAAQRVIRHAKNAL
jgi:hypothetical protein